MFKDKENDKIAVTNIMDELAMHDSSKVHDRHYDYLHCYLLSIYRLLNSIKYIENQNGQSFIISGRR